MTHRCAVRGCPYATRALPWTARYYLCTEHRRQDALDNLRPTVRLPTAPTALHTTERTTP